MIYQKKSPKARLSARLTYENYDFLYRFAGELSLSLAINELLDKMRQSDATFCNPRKPDHTIGVNTYVR